MREVKPGEGGRSMNEWRVYIDDNDRHTAVKQNTQ